MRKYHSLAAHNIACNDFFMKYQDCQYEHPFRKFLGYCNDLEKQMRLCIKEQRQINREKNSQIAKRRRDQIRANKKEETSE